MANRLVVKHATIVVVSGLLSIWYASQVAGNKIRHMHGKALRGVKEPMSEEPDLSNDMLLTISLPQFYANLSNARIHQKVPMIT